MPSTTNRKAVLHAYLKKYCGITWPGWISILVWTPIIIILTTMTIIDLIPLLEDYRRNDPAVQIDVKKDETVGRPSDMTVCLPYYSKASGNIIKELYEEWKTNKTLNCYSIECKAVANHSWNVWNTPSFQSANYSINSREFRLVIHDAIIQKLLNDSNGFEALELMPSGFTWNQPIVDAVSHYFGIVSLLDLTSIGPESHPYVEEVGRHFSQFNLVTDQQREQMYNRMLDIVNAYYKTEASLNSATASFVIPDFFKIEEKKYVTFWSDRFCFQLPSNLSYKSYTFQLINNNETDREPLWKRYKRDTPFQIYEDSAGLYSYPERQDALYSTSEAEMEKLISDEIVVLVYSVESRVNETRQDEIEVCSQTSTPSVCVAERQLRFAIRECKCIPFSLRHLQNNKTELPYCNLKAYKTCWKKLDLNSDNSRVQQCLNKCNDTIYKWRADTQMMSDPSSDTCMFSLDIHLRRTPFIEFTLTEKISFQQFLSQLGGLANLYLGLSGFTVCTILLFCIDNIKRWLRLKNQSVSREENSPASWQFSQMRTFVQLLKNRQTEQRQTNTKDEVQDLVKVLWDEMHVVKQDIVTGQKNTQALSEDIRIIKETLATEVQAIKVALAALAEVPRNGKNVSE